MTGGALSLVLWYGGKLVHERKITTGVLASFLMYTLQVAMAFAFLTSLYGDFMQGKYLKLREIKINATRFLNNLIPKNVYIEKFINLKKMFF